VEGLKKDLESLLSNADQIFDEWCDEITEQYLAFSSAYITSGAGMDNKKAITSFNTFMRKRVRGVKYGSSTRSVFGGAASAGGKQWGGRARGGTVTSDFTPLIYTGTLGNYILDQAMNKTYSRIKARDDFIRVFGILSDFPGYGYPGEMKGLAKIHNGGMIRKIFGVTIAHPRPVPSRPFMTIPYQYHHDELKYACNMSIRMILNSYLKHRKV